MFARLISLYAIIGILALLGSAIFRLAPRALEPLSQSLEWHHYLAYLASVSILAYSEGYRGFQKAFSPRAVVRAEGFAAAPKPALIPLAPMVAMGLIHATKKRLIVSWCVLIGVIVLVISVSYLGPVARGAVDAGVVVGLSWGAAAMVVFWIRAQLGHPPNTPADFPS